MFWNKSTTKVKYSIYNQSHRARVSSRKKRKKQDWRSQLQNLVLFFYHFLGFSFSFFFWLLGRVCELRTDEQYKTITAEPLSYIPLVMSNSFSFFFIGFEWGLSGPTKWKNDSHFCRFLPETCYLCQYINVASLNWVKFSLRMTIDPNIPASMQSHFTFTQQCAVLCYALRCIF